MGTRGRRRRVVIGVARSRFGSWRIACPSSRRPITTSGPTRSPTSLVWPAPAFAVGLQNAPSDGNRGRYDCAVDGFGPPVVVQVPARQELALHVGDASTL